MLYPLIILSGIISLLSIRSTFFPLRFAAGFAWFATFIYWLGADIVVDGSPTDVAVMLTLLFLGFIFVGMGFISRKGSVEVEEERTIGSALKRIKYIAFKNNSSPTRTRETEEEYRQRVHHALTKSKPKRRK